jgi:hypothetical protein
MINSNPSFKKKSLLFGESIVNLIIACVHNKIFPTIVVVLAIAITYPFVLIGPGTFLMKLFFVVLSIPAFIAFALYIYGLCDLAPNFNELYKRFKREFSPDKNY